MRGYNQFSDADLVARLRKGDVAALNALVDMYTERLFAIARITTGSHDLAREAVQDAFVQLWESRQSLDPARSVGGYLIVTTRHRALNLMRHERTHERIAGEMRVAAEIENTELADRNEGEQNIERGELRQAIDRVLSELPPRCREIFLLRWEGGLSNPEIERLLGISNATVRNQISRAAKHVARAVAEGRLRM